MGGHRSKFSKNFLCQKWHFYIVCEAEKCSKDDKLFSKSISKSIFYWKWGNFLLWNLNVASFRLCVCLASKGLKWDILSARSAEKIFDFTFQQLGNCFKFSITRVYPTESFIKMHCNSIYGPCGALSKPAHFVCFGFCALHKCIAVAESLSLERQYTACERNAF